MKDTFRVLFALALSPCRLVRAALTGVGAPLRLLASALGCVDPIEGDFLAAPLAFRLPHGL